MTMQDIAEVPASPVIPPVAAMVEGFEPEPAAPELSLAQEINARRARIENPELLRRLRGL